MKKFLFILLFTCELFAISPYNLEGIKNINVKISDKGKLLSKETKDKISHKIKEELQQLGINTDTKEFVNFVVKIEGVEIKDKQVINLSLIVNENIHPARDPKIQGIGLSYMKNDLFEVEENLEKEINETIFSYLFADFKAQYKEEN